MVKQKCPVCNKELNKIIKRRDKYTYYKCPECCLITSLPLSSDEEIENYYNGYQFNLLKNNKKNNRQNKRTWQDCKKITRDLEKNIISQKKLLDCGGGTGSYANAFAHLGFDVTLIDLDKESCKYATLKYNNLFRVIHGEITTSSLNEKFDYIFLNQVIEHCKDINAIIEKISQLLEEDGTLIITTPNQKSKEFIFRPFFLFSYIFMVTRKRIDKLPLTFLTFLKDPWICCDPPRHIHSFNRKSLSLLLRKHNLKIIKNFTEYSTSQYYS